MSPATAPSFRLALSQSCLEAMDRLPKAISKRFREMIAKYHEDPHQSSLNFEGLRNMRDPKVRSLRINREYRAIVVKPTRGSTLVVVHVDHHDEAYAWARTKKFEVHDQTGHFQVFDELVAEQRAAELEAQPAPSTAEDHSLFHAHDDATLTALGLPAVFVPAVRALERERQLDDFAPHLPALVVDALRYLADGLPVAEIKELVDAERARDDAVDPDDIDRALERTGTQAGFKVVDSEEELEQMLGAPLEKWRVFLHPSQRAVATGHRNGPVRVLGGAGTGKTVAMLHRLKWLAENVFTEKDQRLLVTTYTKNLARDLRSQAAGLLEPEDLARCDFDNLDAVAVHLWSAGGGKKPRIATGDQRTEALKAASAAASGEYAQDWLEAELAEVVLANEITTEAEWFAVSRTGRGDRLARRARADLWPVWVAYRSELEQRGLMEWTDLHREVRERLAAASEDGDPTSWCTALADEVQDLAPSQLRLLRALIPARANDLFLVGDGHQRIYGSVSRLGHCGIEIRGRSRRLRLNYRTTDEIRRRAVAVLEGLDFDDLDEDLDSLTGYHSLRNGPDPVVRLFGRERDEAAAFRACIAGWLEEVPPESICVAARSNRALTERYVPLLEEAGVPHVRINKDNDLGSLPPGVRVSTLHRMKGLEFPRVLVVGVEKGSTPPSWAMTRGEAIRKKERCLLYVAMTRARDHLELMGYGEPSPFIAPTATT